jgi:hypothetical protein
MSLPKNTKPAATSSSSSASTAEPVGAASGPDTATRTATPPRPRTAPGSPAPARTAPPAAGVARPGKKTADRTRANSRPQQGTTSQHAAPAPGTPAEAALASPPPAAPGAGTKTSATPAMTQPAAEADLAAAAAPETGSPDRTVQEAIAGHAGQIREAADAVTAALQAGDLSAALAGIEEIRDHAGNARRALRSATGSRRTPGTATHPGGLREKVAAHLRSHPDKEFTPHEIGKVIGHSSGAIANALDTLVRLGIAELSTEKPRRFRHIAPAGDKRDGATAAASAA